MASRIRDGLLVADVYKWDDGYYELQRTYGSEYVGEYVVEPLKSDSWIFRGIRNGEAQAIDPYTGRVLPCKLLKRANGRFAISTYYGDVVAQLTPYVPEPETDESENDNDSVGVLCVADHTVKPTHDKDFERDGKPENKHLIIKFDMTKAVLDSVEEGLISPIDARNLLGW